MSSMNDVYCDGREAACGQVSKLIGRLNSFDEILMLTWAMEAPADSQKRILSGSPSQQATPPSQRQP